MNIKTGCKDRITSSSWRYQSNEADDQRNFEKNLEVHMTISATLLAGKTRLVITVVDGEKLGQVCPEFGFVNPPPEDGLDAKPKSPMTCSAAHHVDVANTILRSQRNCQASAPLLEPTQCCRVSRQTAKLFKDSCEFLSGWCC